MRKSVMLSTMLVVCSLLFSACSNVCIHQNNGITVTSSLTDKPVLVGDIPCTFPLTKEDTSLNILISGYDDLNPEDVYVWKQYEKMTGVKINWTPVASDERKEKIYNVLINQSDIDLIMRCKIKAGLLTQYGESGLILDLSKNDLLKNNAPNCYAYLQSHPDSLASVTNPDGSIYSIPQVNAGAQLRVSRKLFVNKEWLARVDMELPTTTEEFYQLLKAFKEQDANGNGDPDDEIPFCSQDFNSVQDTMFGAFGLANRGQHNQVVDYDETFHHVRLIASTPEYRSYLQYLKKLYSEKLLDNNIFNMTKEQWNNNAINDRIGVFAHTNLANLPADQMDNFVAIDEALSGPDGYKLWTAVRANFHSTGAAVIPASCDRPDLVLKWLDYFWTDEGTLFYHMGIENETFIVNQDGSYDYAPEIYEQMKQNDLSFDDVVATYSPYPGGGNPTVEIAPYFKGGEMAAVPANAAIKLFQYGPKEYWPSFTFTSEENERLSIIESDIQKYCENSRIDFITGKRSLSEWDAYIAQLDELGIAELLSIYQAAVDRYEGMKP
ncbi:MAG: extracellular solute-binding protein [Clostridia bacterium]|nr:extracellular solute-binding protein [Clostridia bacterium]